MRAVRYRLARIARARLLETMALTAVVAVVTLVVLSVAAGAERTATAPDRFTAANGGDRGVLVFQEGGAPRTAEVGRLPGVSSADSITFLFGALLPKGGSTRPVEASVFAGDGLFVGRQLADGRMPDPNDPTEFVASRTFTEAAGAEIGDTFQLVTLTQATADTEGFETDDPDGPTQTARLVGIMDGPGSLDDPSPVAMFPVKLLATGPIGTAVTIVHAHFAPGMTSARLRTELDTLPNNEALNIQPAVLVSPAVRNAIRAQARGLWALTLVGALAAIVVVGQLISRRVRLSPGERDRLSALGFTGGQVLLESIGRSTLPIVVGVAVGAGLSPLASGRFPFGFARAIEPSPGVRVQPVVLVGGGVVLVLALLGYSLLSLSLTRRDRRSGRPSPTVEHLAGRSPSATAATGLRFAFNRGGNDAGSVRAAIVGLIVIITALVGTVTFAASLDRLVGDGSRYGESDAFIGGDGAVEIPKERVQKALADKDVVAMTYYSGAAARAGRTTVRLVGFDQVRGSLTPPVLDGRLPASDDEIALGRLQARTLGVQVGDSLTLTNAGLRTRFQVTGLAVIPSVGVNDGIGQDGLVTFGGLRSLVRSTHPELAAITLRPGASRQAFFQRIDPSLTADPSAGDPLPAPILNIDRISSIPYLLAALLGALAVLTVAHEMLTSVQNRRRDLAVLRTLGAERPWLSRVVLWQATGLIMLPIAIGTPLGFAAGKLVFTAFADSIGTVNGASIPFVVVAVGAIIALGLALVVSSLPARHAGRIAPAVLLAAE